MAERPRTQTSPAPEAHLPASPGAEPQPAKDAPKAPATAPAAPAPTVRGYVIERHPQGAFQVRTVLLSGDSCTTVETSGRLGYHVAMHRVERMLIKDRGKQ